MGPGRVDALMERERELDVIRRVVTMNGSGSQGLLIEGPPGIGKSRLLAAARSVPDGVRVVNARASELDGDIPFAVVRQLLEPVINSADGTERRALLAGAAHLAEPVLTDASFTTRPEADPGPATLHGLYWLTANLASRQRVLMVVDDVHWCDVASLRWLAYLAPRLDGLEMALVLASRPNVRGPAEALLDALVAVPGVEVLRPAGLSEAAVSDLCSELLDGAPHPRFAAAVQAVTKGNPFLVRELLGELARAGLAPSVDNAALVERQTSRTVSRAALARLRRLSAPSQALAHAVVILGDGWDLPVVARLSGLDEEAARDAADDLASAYILDASRPLRFVHPLVRASVYADMGLGERDQWHRNAAALLESTGATAERVAVHLLASDPAGDAHAVDVLRSAARTARDRGATDVVVRLLRRARREPLTQDVAAELAYELGTAERHAYDLPAAREHLLEAARLLPSPAARARAAGELAAALITNQTEHAVAALSEALADLPDSERELGLRLQVLRLLASEGTPGAWRAAQAAGDRFTVPVDHPSTPAERLSVVALAYQAPYRHPVERGRTLARRALEGGHLLREPGPGEATFYMAPIALFVNDAVEEAKALSGAMVDWARHHGSSFALGQAAEWRSVTWLATGALAEAEADAELALGLADFPVRPAVVTLVSVRLARGDAAGAAELWAATRMDELPSVTRGSIMHLQARAHIRAATGRGPEAFADLLACGRLEDQWDVRTPVLSLWRSDAARIMAGMGRRDEALRLVREDVERCRWFGSVRPLGMALRAAGTLEDEATGLALLEEAVAVLEPSSAHLLHARALLAFGAALRRSGRRNDARKPLLAAVELARRCGVEPLAHRANDELVAAGAKPRRDPMQSRSLLTASELRVARLAAEGRTNREIAQALFLTEKTIEVHLTATYRKLGINSRSQLARSLPSLDPGKE